MNSTKQLCGSDIEKLYTSIQFSVNVLGQDINEISFIVDGKKLAAIEIVRIYEKENH